MLRAKISRLIPIALLTPFFSLSAATANLLGTAPSQDSASSSIAGVPAAASSGPGVQASQADGDKLTAALNLYFQQEIDNPGHSENELDSVRRILISLQKKGVKLTFDPKWMDDRDLRQKIYDLVGSRKVAALSGRAGWVVHTAMSCLMFFQVACGLKGAQYPEEAPQPEVPIQVRPLQRSQ